MASGQTENMLQRYSNNYQRENFIQNIEILLLQGFGESGRRSWSSSTLEEAYDLKIYMTREEEIESKSNRRKRKQELRKTTREKAVKLMQDTDKLNDSICTDIIYSVRLYDWLLKRKIFNPHNCNITGTRVYPCSIKDDHENRSIGGERICGGSFSLLYAVLSKLIKDENMTIDECFYVFRRFGFECKVINPTPEQELLIKLYENNIMHRVNRIGLKDIDERTSEMQYGKKKPKDRKYIRLMINGLNYSPCKITKAFEEMPIEKMTLEEMVETRPNANVQDIRIPHEKEQREKYHTFLGSEYERISPERVANEYYHDFEDMDITSMYFGEDVKNGSNSNFYKKHGEQFRFFIPYDELEDLPLDEEKIEFATPEEYEKIHEIEEYRKKVEEIRKQKEEERAKKRHEQNRKIAKILLDGPALYGPNLYIQEKE